MTTQDATQTPDTDIEPHEPEGFRKRLDEVKAQRDEWQARARQLGKELVTAKLELLGADPTLARAVTREYEANPDAFEPDGDGVLEFAKTVYEWEPPERDAEETQEIRDAQSRVDSATEVARPVEKLDEEQARTAQVRELQEAGRWNDSAAVKFEQLRGKQPTS